VEGESLQKLVKKQEEIIKRQEVEIADLKAQITELKTIIARLQKDSRNSSKPPSSDIVKPKTQVEKRGGGNTRRIGGQKGHIKHERVPFSPEEKVLILREVVEDGEAVSTVANNHEMNPVLILNWRKQMIEQARETFTIKRSDISGKAHERRIKELEAKLLERETLIAELAQENLGLKKKKDGRN
jgi:transposase-like protein